MTKKELISKVKKLEENQMKLLENLPIIIKNIIITEISKENEFKELKNNE